MEAPALVLRPRGLAWLWIAPISFTGLVFLLGSAMLFFSPYLAEISSRPVMGLVAVLSMTVYVAPIANFVNAEVRLTDGVVSKRGAFRTTRRWAAADLIRVDPHIPYNKFAFVDKHNMVAFQLSEAWWRRRDVEALIHALGLPTSKPVAAYL